MLKTEYKLTKEQAEFIKDLRIDKEYSWRAVARDTKKKFPEMGIDSDGGNLRKPIRRHCAL